MTPSKRLVLALVAAAIAPGAYALSSLILEAPGTVETKPGLTVFVPPGWTTSDLAGRRAVILAHGVTANRGHMEPLARECQRRGFLAVTVDGEDDVALKAAIGAAQSQGAITVGIVGHSVGAVVAARTAQENGNVACVVALGQRPHTPPDKPKALLVAAGAMDAFHGYGEVTSVRNEGRRAFVAGTCEHSGEVWDGAIAGETMAFLESSLRGTAPAAEIAFRPPIAASLRFVASLASALALGSVLVALGELVPARVPQAAGLAVAIVPIFVLPELARVWTPPLLAGALVANAILARKPAPGTVRATVASLVAGWVGGTALGALPAFLAEPSLLLGLPVYAWQSIAFRLEFTVQSAGGKLVSDQGGATWLVWGLVALEVVAPGRALGAVAKLVFRAFSALGGKVKGVEEVRAEAAAEIDKHSKKLQTGVAVGLGGLAVFFAVKNRDMLREEGAAAQLALGVLRTFVLPVVVATVSVWTTRLVGLVRGSKA